jgi:hypothetical protein
MTELCRATRPSDSLSQQTVAKRNETLAAGATPGTDAAFWDALHHRTCDQIGWTWGRWWLQHHSRLEPAVSVGWPVLRLIFTAVPPREASPLLLHRYFRAALAQRCKTGPLGDLASSLELVEVAR